MLNHHAKSRYNGRMITDEQRTNAALDLIDYIYQAPTEYVALLGDFNDRLCCVIKFKDRTTPFRVF
ncbi:hypothetical protein AB6E26_23550, partial [Vibrio splendidus]